MHIAANATINLNYDALKVVVKSRRQTQVLYELFPKDFQKRLKADIRREDLAGLAATAKASRDAEAGRQADNKTPKTKKTRCRHL